MILQAVAQPEGGQHDMAQHDMAQQGMPLGSAETFFQAAWEVTLELAPWLLLGTVVATILHLVIPPGLIHRRLRGPGGVLAAVVLGVPLPLCSCGVIPAGIGLRRDGASRGASVGFLISTPQTGVDSVLVSASFLGWPFAFFKLAVAGSPVWLVAGSPIWSREKSGNRHSSHRLETNGSGRWPMGWRTVSTSCAAFGVGWWLAC